MWRAVFSPQADPSAFLCIGRGLRSLAHLGRPSENNANNRMTANRIVDRAVPGPSSYVFSTNTTRPRRGDRPRDPNIAFRRAGEVISPDGTCLRSSLKHAVGIVPILRILKLYLCGLGINMQAASRIILRRCWPSLVSSPVLNRRFKPVPTCLPTSQYFLLHSARFS